MKVGGAGGSSGDAKGASEVGGAKAGKGKKSPVDAVESPDAVSFAESLSEAKDRAARLEWETLLDHVEKAGRRLVEHSSPDALADYKGLVGALLDRVVKGSFRIESVESARFAVNQKVFQIARRIDEALEEIAREILSKNADATRVLTRTDEIRGLLLDILR